MTTENEMIYDPIQIREKMEKTLCPDGGCQYTYSDAAGSIQSVAYAPFPGVALVQKAVHMPRFITNWRYGPKDAVAIEYCHEGRLECQVGEECLYVAPGDIVFFRTDLNARILRYPGSHYHATTVNIFLNEPSPVLDIHLKMADFSIDMLSRKYLPDGQYYSVLTRTDELKAVFEGMKHAPEQLKSMYYGVKILEAMVLLASGVVDTNDHPVRRISKHQAEMVKCVYRYIMERPERRYTIEQLSKQFSVSATQLKNGFQIVYGIPMQKFIREQKMIAAAKILATTDMKVTEVALMFGYNNTSKFADAFHSVIGESPKQYSMKYRAFSGEEN